MNDRFLDHPMSGVAAEMVKVFGCRQAFENRPSTNPRACGDGLWGFRFLAWRDDGGIAAAMLPAGPSWVRFFAAWPLDRDLAGCEFRSFCRYLGEGRVCGHWPELGCCGVR